jgi:predicted Mrr-cat superfamily restriction endonuclease
MKMIINCETGEVIERELNKAEKDQEKIDQKVFEAVREEIIAKENAKLAVAEKLGLTADELKLLLG